MNLLGFLQEPTGKPSVTRLTILLLVAALLVIVGCSCWILVRHHDWINQSVIVFVSVLLLDGTARLITALCQKTDVPIPSVSSLTSDVEQALGATGVSTDLPGR